MFRRTIGVTTTIGLLAALCASLAGAAADNSSNKGTARASIAGVHVALNGSPFFPVMLIDQCSADAAARARTLGINLIVNESCPGLTATRQLQAIEGHTLAVLSIAAKHVRGNRLVGWTFPDEPEGSGWTPASLQRAHPVARGTRDGLLTFMTTGAGFYRSSYTSSSTTPAAYGQYARLADVAGFDLYPLGHCSSELSAVYDAQVAFNRLAGRMPTFQWIETGAIRPEYCGGFKMQPAELRAEVWLAVAGGARGIGYFTHTWSPDHKAFDVSPSIESAIAKTNNLLAAVRPALLGQTILSGVNSSVGEGFGPSGRQQDVCLRRQRRARSHQRPVPRAGLSRRQRAGVWREAQSLRGERRPGRFVRASRRTYLRAKALEPGSKGVRRHKASDTFQQQSGLSRSEERRLRDASTLRQAARAPESR